MTPVYLDHHATTPCDPRVVDAMLPFFTEVFGNAASVTHDHGRAASRALEDARYRISRALGVLPPEICFTAGATEANNTALEILRPGDHLVTSQTEHRSILAPAERLARRGVAVTFLQPDREGVISPEAVREALRPETRLVSIEWANGEIGTVQPIGGISAICREKGVLFHSDATQAAGKVAVELSLVDLASLSAHKMYGPKGIGALFVRRGVKVEPLIAGGGQERGVRAGTVNVPGAVGMAKALELCLDEMPREKPRLIALRDDLWEGIESSIERVSINGPRGLRLPGNLNVTFDGIDADSLILGMKRFSLSSGSACSSGERGPSRVLTAIGCDDRSAMGSIRFGLGRGNTAEQMPMLIEDLTRTVRRLREITPA